MEQRMAEGPGQGERGRGDILSTLPPLPNASITTSAEADFQTRGIQASVTAANDAERRLVQRVYARCDKFIQEACRLSSVRAEFLGALTANESGGNPAAVRFEPSVYRHLKAVAAGGSPRYGSICDEALQQELAKVLHPKTGEFYGQFLNSLVTPGDVSEISRQTDEALRELASSWGFVQIMGFHVIGRAYSVHDLLDPRVHYQVASQLLAEFAESYQLDLAHEFAELFCCWNTGRSEGKTADPGYVQKGLMRLGIHRELMAAVRK